MQRQVTKRQVQVIQPTIKMGFMGAAPTQIVKQRVAAYARVSTEHEEQQNSYEAQVDHYTKEIKRHFIKCHTVEIERLHFYALIVVYPLKA